MLTHDFVSKRKGYILSALINILFAISILQHDYN